METAEVEFSGRHPDVFSSCLAAEIVKGLSKLSDKKNIKKFRAGLNVQSLSSRNKKGLSCININVGGQVIVPKNINLNKVITNITKRLLKKAGYFKAGDFSPRRLIVNTRGITSQSPALNKTTNSNRFADSCVVYGHYIRKPFGINGTFPSLMIAKKIDNCISKINRKIPNLRPDGKVHVTIKYKKIGFSVENVYLSVSHKKGILSNFRNIIKNEIIKNLKNYDVNKLRIEINSGGDFDAYFLQADSGISKAKDDIIITGGIHHLGTDKVWGKCLYKASSTLIPYVFALSRLVCDTTKAKYASVSAFSKYGQKHAELQLHDIDPDYEDYREKINFALNRFPRDRNSIRKVLALKINTKSYESFNDIEGFHNKTKPWKRANNNLRNILKKKLIINFKNNKGIGGL